MKNDQLIIELYNLEFASSEDWGSEFKKGLCACMGPGYNEPFCYCEMRERGLKPSKERIVQSEISRLEWVNLVNSGIFSKKD